MSGHTDTPWFVREGTFTTTIAGCGGQVRPPDVAQMVESRDVSREEVKANARRIVAAVNATKEFTIEGLEQIVANGKALELALLASANLLVLDEAQQNARAGFEVIREDIKAAKEKVSNA